MLKQDTIIEINAVRPLAELALFIEQKYDSIVTYEDILKYENKLPKDNTSQSPLFRQIRFAVAESDTPENVLQKGIIAYNEMESNSAFKFYKSNYAYHMSPDRVRVNQDIPIPYFPLQLTKIKVDSITDNGFAILEQIVNKWDDAVDQKIEIGIFPHNLFQGQIITVKGQNDTARACLEKLFIKMGRRLSWQILNTPNTDHFVLNIHLI